MVTRLAEGSTDAGSKSAIGKPSHGKRDWKMEKVGEKRKIVPMVCGGGKYMHGRMPL